MVSKKERFSERVDDYARYRPTYPPQLLAALGREGQLAPGMTIADVGSGTGIMTSMLLAHGFTVKAVEPNAPMRTAAEQQLGANPRFQSIDGAAEATGLPDASVHGITAAQAFHWFKHEQTRAEFHRIVQPPGTLALIWNERLATGSRFDEGYEQALIDYGVDYLKVDHRRVDDEVVRAFAGGAPVRYFEFDNEQRLDLPGLIGRTASCSYAPPRSSASFPAMQDELTRLFEQSAVAGRICLRYRTQLYLTRLC